jgi:hypothetical protein
LLNRHEIGIQCGRLHHIVHGLLLSFSKKRNIT